MVAELYLCSEDGMTVSCPLHPGKSVEEEEIMGQGLEMTGGID